MKIIPNRNYFNIGDVVILKPFPNDLPKYNYLHFNPQMLEFCGIPQIIYDINHTDKYIMIKIVSQSDGELWTWPSDYVKLATKEYENIT